MAEFTSDLTLRVLSAVAAADAHDSIWWRCDEGYAPITFFVNCSDLFAYATADLEPITPDTVTDFEQAFAEVARATGGDATWGPILYACRRRRTRPQGGSYPSDERLWKLFDGCGPQRDLDLDNPHLPGRRPAART